MRYLIRKKRSKVKHIWSDVFSDTACRMYSTGGLNPRKYRQTDTSDLPTCENCERNMELAKTGRGYRAKYHKPKKTHVNRQPKKRYNNSHTYYPDSANDADKDAEAWVRKHGGW